MLVTQMVKKHNTLTVILFADLPQNNKQPIGIAQLLEASQSHHCYIYHAELFWTNYQNSTINPDSKDMILP